MIHRYWEQRPAVALTLRRVKPKSRGGLPSFAEHDLTLMPEIIKLLIPLQIATKCLSEEKRPTISITAPTLATLTRHFKPEDNDSPVISKMKETFREDFDTRYTYIQDFLYKASALDPRFKELEFLDDDLTRDTVFLEITTEVEKLVIVPLMYFTKFLLNLCYNPMKNSKFLFIILRQRRIVG